MRIYNETNYREALKNLIQDRKRLQPHMNQTKVAEAIGVHTTYLTNVFKGRADLSQDQLYLFCKFLSLTDEEHEFLLILLERDRTGLANRRELLDQQIEALREKYGSPDSRLGLKKTDPEREEELHFYLDAYPTVVHQALRSPAFAGDLDYLSKELQISRNKLAEVILLLEKLSLIEWNEKSQSYEVKVEGRHLPRTHPLCQPHQSVLRFSGSEHIAHRDPRYRESFFSTFSSNEPTVRKIYANFLTYAKEQIPILEGQKTNNEVFQLNFDLFSWFPK